MNLFNFLSRSLDLRINLSMLLLRLTFGILMIPHGYGKFITFEQKQTKFMQFFGLSAHASLSLTIFAEMICAGLIVLGLFTRLASIPLIITAMVIVFWAHQGDILGDASSGFFYLIGYIVILLLGPGKYSLDSFFESNLNFKLFVRDKTITS